MAIEFIIEDGTGKSDSTSYIDVTDFRQYWENRGITFAQTDDEIKTWLNRSTQYIDDNYTFKGVRTVDGQALQWPRVFVMNSEKPPIVIPSTLTNTWRNLYDKRTTQYIESNEIPQSVIYALCELANIASTEIDLYGTSSNGIASMSLGRASKSYSSFAQSGIKEYRSVNKYLNGLTMTGSLVRV